MSPLQRLIYLEQDARKFGFDWPDQFMILDQIIDECREVREEIGHSVNREKLQEEIGDLLHGAISLCVFSGFSAEETISKTNTKFSRRMRLLKELTQSRGLENLRGQNIDFMLNLWREVKQIEHLIEHLSDASQKYNIIPFSAEHIPPVVEAFNQIGWNKPASLFEGYLKEQEAEERIVWVAYINCHQLEEDDPEYGNLDSRMLGNDKRECRNDRKHLQFAGYVTLKWRSKYPFFQEQHIPEIMDLNVLPHYRKMGIGSILLDTAEKEAATRSDTIGIGVGLYVGEDGGYGAAQRLYVKRGYVPDGKGVTYNYQPASPRNTYSLDDELVLWFTKKLS